MRTFNVIVLFVVAMLSFGSAVAETTRVDVGNEDVESSERLLTITVALPSGAIGKRIDKAVLEVPVTLVESPDSAFNDFPVLELRENGSEAPKQTVLLEKGFAGIARFDITRLVRGWANTDAHQIMLGALAESNGTTFGLGEAAQWSVGTKARLIVDCSELKGERVSSNAR